MSVTVFKDLHKEEGDEEEPKKKIKRPKIRIVKMRLCILLLVLAYPLYCELRKEKSDRENVGDYEILF